MKKWLFCFILPVLICGLFACSQNSQDLPTPSVARNDDRLPATKQTDSKRDVSAQTGLITDLPENSNYLTGELTVVYEKAGCLWISTPEKTTQLTNAGNDVRPRISKDGNLIVFQRGNELWVLEISTRQERKLYGEDGASPLQYEFSPISQLIYFTTKTLNGEPRFDFNSVDGNLGGYQILLPPGGAGQFTANPSWQTFALVQPGKIITYNVQDRVARRVFSYPIAAGHSVSYLPEVAWLNNGYWFNAIIPDSGKTTMRLMFFGTDAGKPAQIAEFSVELANIGSYKISPDASAVLYLKSIGNNLEIHVIDASTTDRPYTTAHREGHIGIIGWSPNSKNIIYWLNKSDDVWISSTTINSVLSDVGGAQNIKWQNPNTFIFLFQSDLRIMTLGQPSKILVTGVSGEYDWVFTPKK